MKIELKLICEQLKEALGLKENRKVAALIDKNSDDETFVGWMIVQVNDDGSLTPELNSKCNTVKELLDFCKHKQWN